MKNLYYVDHSCNMTLQKLFNLRQSVAIYTDKEISEMYGNFPDVLLLATGKDAEKISKEVQLYILRKNVQVV